MKVVHPGLDWKAVVATPTNLQPGRSPDEHP
jgi:hypothetical protein